LNIIWLKLEVSPEWTQQDCTCSNDLFMWKEVLCEKYF